MQEAAKPDDDDENVWFCTVIIASGVGILYGFFALLKLTPAIPWDFKINYRWHKPCLQHCSGRAQALAVFF